VDEDKLPKDRLLEQVVEQAAIQDIDAFIEAGLATVTSPLQQWWECLACFSTATAIAMIYRSDRNKLIPISACRSFIDILTDQPFP